MNKRGRDDGRAEPGNRLERPGRSEQHEQRPRGCQKAEWANGGAHRPAWLEHSLCEGDCKKMRRQLLGAHPKRTMPGRQKSSDVLLQGEERATPLEPCRKRGPAALHQRLGKQEPEGYLSGDEGKIQEAIQEREPGGAVGPGAPPEEAPATPGVSLWLHAPAACRGRHRGSMGSGAGRSGLQAVV